MKQTDAARVAEAMNTTIGTLRKGLEQGVFPFGCAVETSRTGNKVNYSYLLFKTKVKEYLGIDLTREIVQFERNEE